MNDSLDRLYASVLAARGRNPAISRTSRLFREGVQKMAKKLAKAPTCSITLSSSGPNAASRRKT
jgi:hypothetical protein